ncbi:hypothetical protein ACLOJK_017570 [Asimina triloba]
MSKSLLSLVRRRRVKVTFGTFWSEGSEGDLRNLLTEGFTFITRPMAASFGHSDLRTLSEAESLVNREEDMEKIESTTEVQQPAIFNMEQPETAETETADHTGDARITIPPEQPDYTANHAVHHPAQIEEEANATILMTVIIGIIQTAATPLLGYTSNQTTIRAKSHTLFLYSNVILTFVTCLLGAAILIMYLFCGRTPRYSRIVKILLLAEIGSFTLALFLGVIFYLATS